MSKIAFIGQKGMPSRGGGVERHVEELSTRLAELGHDVLVYSRKGYNQEAPETYKGVQIVFTPAIYTKHLEAISHALTSLFDLIRRDVDVVHFQSIGPSLLIPLAKILKPRAKIVSTIHSPDYFHQKWNWFARLSLRLGEIMAARFADSAITVSKNLERYLWHAYHCEATYIPNGVPLPRLGSNANLLSEWDLEPQKYIVAISRLVRHKGVHLLIDAYQRIETDKKLVIVGGSEYTDDYLTELQEMAGCNPNIVFAGKQNGEKLAALFEHAYVFVQPSLSEGLSIALLEALSYNQAILASDIPENLEVIENKGLTFAQGNALDLENRLSFLLSHPQIVKQYKQGGRDYVAQEYDWDKIAKRTSQVYSDILMAAKPVGRIKKVRV